MILSIAGGVDAYCTPWDLCIWPSMYTLEVYELLEFPACYTFNDLNAYLFSRFWIHVVKHEVANIKMHAPIRILSVSM